MNALDNTPSPFNNGKTFSKNEFKLPKLVGAIIVCLLAVGTIYEGGVYYKKHQQNQLAKIYDRYEAVGGRTYEGFVNGYFYNSETDKTIQYIELLGSDTPIYLHHPGVPKTTLRDTARLLEMNRTIFKSSEKTETRYLRVGVTHYFNRTTKDRINVMMSAEIIPPIEAPKPDMDTERTIFRHPDTFEVIPKYLYEEIMAERKAKEDFINEVNKSLNEPVKEFSRYTKIFTLKK